MTVRRRKRRAIRRKGPKRHLRRSLVIAVLVLVLMIVGIVKIPGMITDAKLRKLGYNEVQIKKIHTDRIADTILKDQYYSEYLAQCIQDSTLRKEYISLYTKVDSSRGLSDTSLLLYNRLEDLGYEEDQLDDLFENLYDWEIAPLLVFDYQWDETEYIKDCKAHRDTNSQSSFTLDGDYLREFKNISSSKSVDDPILINTKNNLDESYVPSDLTDITTEYAASGQQMCKEAASAFLLMAKAALLNDTPFFASATYISYADQQAAYKSISSQVGADLADVYSERAGFSEHQTGLAVNISATYEDNKNLTSTKVYEWLTANCAKYGFILRYPPSKAAITDQADEAGHLLYVGKDLAQRIKDSELTYDEYYELFLASWYDQSCMPSADILNSTSCTDALQCEAGTEASPEANS